MNSRTVDLQHSALQLSSKQRWKLAVQIWESLEQDAEVALPEWQKEILDQRTAEDEKSASPWSRVKKRILGRL